MELTNATALTAGYTLGIDPEAREHIVVAVKGTFVFPARDGDACERAEVQAPLVLSDVHWGAPGFSAPRYEVDFARRKPRCDVILNASAHAPDDRPAERVRVGAKVGSWSKILDVVGDRVWLDQAVRVAASAPLPFLRKRIAYDDAFGGVDDLDPDEATPEAYPANPVGRGWHRIRNRARIVGAPLPSVERPDDPVRAPWGDHAPAGFGIIARGWPARLRFAGTYDQAWIDEVFPFLPADFDDRHFQAAPEDQQIDPLRGGEEVVLANLTPEGRTRFRLPVLGVQVHFFRRRGGHETRQAMLDTLLIEPDERRLLLTWRASIPLRRDIFEIPEAVVGPRPRGWWRARTLGKTWYPSLGDLVRARRPERDAP